MTVYNTQNYWVPGLCLSSGILNTRKHSISETQFVSVLRWGEETPTLLGPLERDNLNSYWIEVRRKQIQFSKPCFLVFRIKDDGQSPETVILIVKS
jgi:hypothetical protein